MDEQTRLKTRLRSRFKGKATYKLNENPFPGQSIVMRIFDQCRALAITLSFVISTICGGDVSINIPFSVSSHLTIQTADRNLTSQLEAGRKHNTESILSTFRQMPTEKLAGTLLGILGEVGDMELVDKVRVS